MSKGKELDQKRKITRVKFISWVLLCFIIITVVISLNTGPIKISPKETLMTMIGQGTPKDTIALFSFRLPRIIIALLVGIGLATSGVILQGLVRNPLADPGIMGINAGAGLAVMIFLAFFTVSASTPVFIIPFLAFLGAGGVAALIYLMAYKKSDGVPPIRLILTGIAIAAGINALMIVLTLTLNPDQYQFLATWVAGSIWGSNWRFVLSIAPWLFILLPFVYMKSPVLNILRLGEETAIGLGARLEKERRILLIIAVALAGVSVSISGGIGFVGLIAPHLARRLVGDQHERVIPIAALLGAWLLLVADTIGRSIIQPSEIPAGIIVAIIGAPYFLYLLATAKN